MKKLFLTICLTIILFTPASAACNGGTEYVIDGYTFCVSKISLNWWSAANWCQANGMHVATINELCPDWTRQDLHVCGRTLPAVGSCWTATAAITNYESDRNAYSINTSTGSSSMGYRTNYEPAICVYQFAFEMKIYSLH